MSDHAPTRSEMSEAMDRARIDYGPELPPQSRRLGALESAVIVRIEDDAKPLFEALARELKRLNDHMDRQEGRRARRDDRAH